MGQGSELATAPDHWQSANPLAATATQGSECAKKKLGIRIALAGTGNCCPMLRITVREHPEEERWILQGRLHKGSVQELISSWNACRARQCRRVVDLDEVTSIDRSGEEALLMMIGDGAELVASGIYTRHLIEELKARNRNLPQH
jgi:hypothetical protein